MHIAKKKVGNEFVGRHTFYIRDPSCPSYCEITVHAIVMTVPFFFCEKTTELNSLSRYVEPL
jgi:hypothetical protein